MHSVLGEIMACLAYCEVLKHLYVWWMNKILFQVLFLLLVPKIIEY